MPDIRTANEADLMQQLLHSNAYLEFKRHRLPKKVEREQRAWALLQEHRGHYTKDALDQIFDTVDLFDGSQRWFGALLAKPNRNLMFSAASDHINQWFEELLFSGKEAEVALNVCLRSLKIKGASKGLATLLLYLSAPDKYSVWVNATEEGLYVLNRIGELKGNDWGENYTLFNRTATDFRTKHGLQPQEIDWLLTLIGSYVEAEGDHFRIGEDILEAKEVAVAVDDEADLDDVVGQPMELKVMRWSPTNEMGVVALFIEFRKELGFPLIEVIRTNFPDAAVFEDATKGFVRRYIEFEFRSSGYKAHLKSKRKCHYVVCWEHDWKDCPIPVIELKKEISAILSKHPDQV